MCIFFCLSNTCLSHVMCCQILTKRIVKFYFLECNDCMRNRCVILSEAYICQIQLLLSCKSVKLICTESSGNLSCTVRTEVEEDNRILVLNGRGRVSVFHNHARFYELIVYFFLIRILYSADRAVSRDAFSLGQSLVCQLHTIPSVITVHSIIATHNGCHFANTDLFHLIN